MNWGHYIALTLAAFAGIIICLITISMKQDVSLVAVDYYKQEIAYQDQIDKITNFAALEEQPTFKLNAQEGIIEVSFPSVLIPNLSNGNIQLYRPSDARDDRLIKLVIEEKGKQEISTKNMRAGLWRAKINFELNEKQYYHEQNIIL